MPKSERWPVLRSYDADHLARIAFPLGGIGTGTVSLGGRGNLIDWEIANRPAKGFRPFNCFFAAHFRPKNGPTVTRALEGVIPPTEYEAGFGSLTPNHGLPRFRRASFDAAYPLAQVNLSDPQVPAIVRLEAMNPLIPGDADASGIPFTLLRYVIENKTQQEMGVSICGTVTNFIGSDGQEGKASKNHNRFRAEKIARGILLEPGEVDPAAPQWGTMALVTTARAGVTHRTAWAKLSWGDSLLDFWDDFSGDGKLEERALEKQDQPQASLAVSVRIPAGASRSVTFLLAWHFPNRRSWTPKKKNPGDSCCSWGANLGQECATIGNYYATQYRDAWDVIEQTVPRLNQLETKTVSFVRAFCQSDLPDVVKEAALFNVSTLRTQTTFRLPSGELAGWEGCADHHGCCPGSCTHVWNYEHTTPFLFADLARSMRKVELENATRDDGQMSFRIHLPLVDGTDHALAAADGQMGTIMKFYREWQLCGDLGFLKSLWPKAKSALAFCWIPGGWDADQDGVMEGCQHNTMDVEYFGPNPQMTGWYLGALRAAEEMALAVGDDPFAQTCRRLFESGSKWMDENLFNGEYYEQRIVPPTSLAAIASGLRHESMGSRNLTDPDFQIGSGCLIDQLVGQFTAHVCGLGYLHDPKKVRSTLRSVLKYNYRANLYGHFNHNRSFALNDESALLMCSFPKGNRPRRPFPYCNEVMTGFEYTAAIGMIYEGDIAAGLKCISDVRDRYDGSKRSPFDEAECGHHYARAMVAWAAVIALTGFHYSAVNGSLAFSAPESGTARYFFSTGAAWGTASIQRRSRGASVTLELLHGSLELRSVGLHGMSSNRFPKTRKLRPNRPITIEIKASF